MFRKSRRIKKNDEIERTCERDGTKWYITGKQLMEREPNRLLRAGAKTYMAGSQMSFGTGSKTAGAVMVGQQDAAIARIQDRNHCPSCGSTKFTQRVAE